MGNLSVIVGADTSKFINEVKNARAVLDQFVSDTEKASEAAKENASVSEEQVQAYEKVISKLEKVAEGTMSAKQQQSALKKEIQELKDQWNGLSNDAKSSSFGQAMAETMRAAKEELANLKGQMASVDDVKPSGTLKKELRLTTNELVQLTAQYRAMSAAEKQSAEGQALASKMDELRAKAGELKDTIGDVNQEITVMASDTPNLDVFNDVLGIGADLLSTYSSVVAKVTGDEKALKNAIATVMAVQSAANLVTKVTNALQSSSAIMLKTRAIQEAAAAAAIRVRTAAEGKGTIATKAATAAQAAFNVVAKANPYVLLAMAVIAVGSALLAFAGNSDKATEAEKKSQEAAEKAKKSWEDFKDTAANSGATLLATYNRLRVEWGNLKSDHEKNQWIKDNKAEFDKLGVSIGNVSDAENFLVGETENVVKAFMLRAKAAAYAAQTKEMYADYIKKEQEYEKQMVHAGDPVPKHAQPSSVYRDNNGHGTTANGGKYNVNNALTITSFTEKGAEEYNEQLKQSIGLTDELNNNIEQSTRKEVELIQESNKLLTNSNVKTTHTGTTTPAKTTTNTTKTEVKPQFAPGSLAAMEDELSKLKSDYKKGWRTDLDSKSFNKELRKLSRAVRNKKIELGLVAEFTPEMQKELEREIKQAEYDLSVSVDEKSKKEIEKELDKLMHLKASVDFELAERDRLKLEPVIDFDELDKLLDDVGKQMMEAMSKKYDFIEFPPDPTSGLGKWKKKAENELRRIKFLSPEINLKSDDLARKAQGYNRSLTDDMDYHKTLMDSLQSKYDKVIERIKKCTSVTYDDLNALRQYVSEEEKLNKATEIYHGIMRAKELGLATTEDVTEAELKYLDACDDLRFVQDKYGAIAKRVRELTGLTNAEVETMNIYENSAESLDKLTEAYKRATDAAYEFNRKSMLSEKRWDVFKSGIGTIDHMQSSVSSLAQSYADIGGKELSKDFKKTMAVMDATISTINAVIGAYEDIMGMIKLFGEISEISAAKKVAANTAEMASDETLLATETANTQVKVANDTAENTSEIGKLGVKEAGALASATASGASLPFPANIAAIAAGIAAVVAAFAMVFSAFEEGGIVGGRTSIGDYNLARVNKGEMILNGTQQKRLFNLLNGTGSRISDTVGKGGEVTFHIKGNDLYGVLTNRNKKVSKI